METVRNLNKRQRKGTKNEDIEYSLGDRIVIEYQTDDEEEEEEEEEEDESTIEMDSIEIRDRIMHIWSIPAKGHSNPALCFTNHILLKLDEMKISKIVFYSCASFRDSILNLPNNVQQMIEFRDYEFEKHAGTDNFLKLIMDFDTRPGSLFRFFQCWENAINLGCNHVFKKLFDDMHREHPVLVVYDQALFFCKLALTLYSRLYANDPQPLKCCYVTSFLCAKGIFPFWSDMFKLGMMGPPSHMLKNVLITVGDFFTYTYRYYKTLWDHGFSMYDFIYNVDVPFGRNVILEDLLNLVFVLPEVQPRMSKFDPDCVKFVGPALDENVRSQMSDYSDMIERFFLKNSKPIIYVSMGTVFNFENSNLFDIIVQACKSFSDSYSVIVSTGDEKTYEKYAGTTLSDVIFVPHTPQIEILKRTHLFITHAGMNSVSEAVHFGVPIICVPLFGDQPFVAWRVAEQLGIGIKLEVTSSFTVERVESAISDVLNNPSYRKRVNELSHVSKCYCGPKLAVEYLVDFIKKNDSFLNEC